MRSIIFSIRGNQKDTKSGNPIAYKRTIAGKFRKDSVEYMDWKEYVRAELSRTGNILDADGENKWAPFAPKMMTHRGVYYPVLVEKGEKARVEIAIEWADWARRGDGDNVLKGILDAIFANDKIVYAGSYESRPSARKRGHVGIVIEIEPDDEV
ncbi:MAG: RusA family crossover junction endodeoxyribonuclease [Patescibacteria group bacterium]|nr:RusA family crossover junction endodeoxyribonuclease [Patescibacteria group bacterium]